MSDSDRTDLETLNEASKAIADQLFDAGLEHVTGYAAKYDIRESDIPLVLANAYLRDAYHRKRAGPSEASTILMVRSSLNRASALLGTILVGTGRIASNIR